MNVTQLLQDSIDILQAEINGFLVNIDTSKQLIQQRQVKIDAYKLAIEKLSIIPSD